MRILGVAMVALVAFIVADPLKLSPIVGIDFLPEAISIPPPSEWPQDSANKLRAAKRMHERVVQGPESLAFDAKGDIYSGVSDGRVLKFSDGTITEFVPSSAPGCQRPFPESLKYEHVCGRKLGLRFDPKGSGTLFMADAYFGLQKVGPEGGVPELLTNEAEGVPFKFTNDLDIDDDGVIYFTDTSTKYHRRHFLLEIMEAGALGRLLKYDPVANETSVLVRDLRFPNGVALSRDRSFLLVNELTLCRIIRYWLKGPKAGTWDVFMELPGLPDNIRANGKGEFWVAMPTRRTPIVNLLMPLPWARKALLSLPVKLPVFLILMAGRPSGLVIKVNEEGQVLDVLEDLGGKVVGMVSEAEEHNGKLWIGSVIHNYFAVYDLATATTK